MILRVGLTPAARHDVERIHLEYSTSDPAAAERLIRSFDVTIDRLRMFPQGAPSVQGLEGVRRARMHRLPFGLFYRVEVTQILVIRVLHTRQEHRAHLDPRA